MEPDLLLTEDSDSLMGGLVAHLLDLDAFGVVIVHSVQRCFGNSVRHSTGGSRREGGYPKGNHDLSYALFRSVQYPQKLPRELEIVVLA